MKPTIKFISLMFFIFIISLAIISCGEDKPETKSMDELRNEEGIPVKVEEVKYQPFTKYLTFFSKLTGIKEATKASIVGGKIERINATVGDYVREKQVIVEFDIYNPGVQYEQAKSAYENLKKNYDRVKALLAAGETSQANYDAIETQYLVAKRNYESVRQMLFIEAPFDGILVDMKVNPGDNVRADVPLFTVSQTNKMRSKIWVSEKEISQFKKGMKAVTEYDGQQFIGKVVEISLAMDPARQAFFVEVEFDNPKGIIKSGVTNEIRILTYEKPNAIIIQRSLVNKDENGNYVFVVQNNKAIKKYITNGNESGLYYEVSGGLQVGDLLVVKGASQLEDGSKVNVIQ
ncbi:MAG: efflux RND transporter periplasmic adaptor subunit [Ignavibacterium album]|uniref:efflux RND transporter periplasmic adaptor subunit n=1 Tax=Ignavibacterium album TaxID=591197 RepID=UPI0026E92EEC|nr:efflux RND transporter periplasmic adaptor subunit [Ignavibacterium album]MCX8105760.1 efflux RND transporter periplasmic adaptor subunit [Ignavibacterium album]